MAIGDRIKILLETDMNKPLGVPGLDESGKLPIEEVIEEIPAEIIEDIPVSKIADFPEALPASDVPEWAKSATKPTYTASEVGADPIGTTANAIATLNVTDSAVSGKYVSSVSEINGKITVTRENLPDYSNTYDTKGAANDALTSANAYTDEKIDSIMGEGAAETLDTIGEISKAIEENQDILDTLNSAIGSKAATSDLTDHTTNKSNPHGVTKTQVGLGNVENKSSATIRGELTKQNVTDALGYTPSESDTVYNHPTTHPASMITGLASVATSGSYNDLSNKPTSLPADGGNADTVNGLTVQTAVPANAKFTDTTYSAAGTALGLVKSGGDVTISDGVITVNDDSHAHVISNVDGLQAALDGKSPTSHTHSAYANQNAFSNVKVGDTTIAADTTTDTLTLAGSNVTITPDATNDKVTIGITKANVTDALGYTPLSEHPTITMGEDMGSMITVGTGSSITMIDAITRDDNGHVTEINTKTVKLSLPANNGTATNADMLDGKHADAFLEKVTTIDADDTFKNDYKIIDQNGIGLYQEYIRKAKDMTDVEDYVYKIFRVYSPDVTTGDAQHYTDLRIGVNTDHATWNIFSTGLNDNEAVLMVNNKKVLTTDDTATAAEGISYYDSTDLELDKITCRFDASLQAAVFKDSNSERVTFYADKAAMLSNTTAIGSATRPVYFNASGVPVAGTYTLGDACNKTVLNNTAIGTLGWTSALGTRLPTLNTLAYWNGTYSGTSSNLAYCNKGAFGSIITKSTGDYLPISGGNLTGELSLQPSGTTEGGQVNLKAATSGTTYNGIAMDQNAGNLRIFGIPSADGTTKTGTGTPLIINPYSKTITGGYTITGTLSGNASTATTATNIKTTAVVPTTSTYYYPTFADSNNSSATAEALKTNTDVRFNVLKGTASAEGYALIQLGNNTASGTANNASGYIRLFGAGAYYSQIKGSNPTANITVTMPTSSGTMALTSSTVSRANYQATAAGSSAANCNKTYLRQIASGTAAATTTTCPAGALYGQYS